MDRNKMTKFFSGFAAALIAGLALLAGPALAQDAGYKLRPGDVVQIEVVEDSSLNRSFLVLPNGSITVPQAGTLRVGGQTPDQVRATLTAALAPNFAAPPTVYVSVASVAAPAPLSAVGTGAAVERTMDVYVMGEVSAPGLKKVSPDTNLLQLLAQSGALSKFAADSRIELHRKDKSGKAVVYAFDLKHVAGTKGRISGMTQIAPGDVIVVPQRHLFE
jgi:polysaccharide biosynthesis/export protein